MTMAKELIYQKRKRCRCPELAPIFGISLAASMTARPTGQDEISKGPRPLRAGGGPFARGFPIRWAIKLAAWLMKGEAPPNRAKGTSARRSTPSAADLRAPGVPDTRRPWLFGLD